MSTLQNLESQSGQDGQDGKAEAAEGNPKLATAGKWVQCWIAFTDKESPEQAYRRGENLKRFVAEITRFSTN